MTSKPHERFGGSNNLNDNSSHNNIAINCNNNNNNNIAVSNKNSTLNNTLNGNAVRLVNNATTGNSVMNAVGLKNVNNNNNLSNNINNSNNGPRQSVVNANQTVTATHLQDLAPHAVNEAYSGTIRIDGPRGTAHTASWC